MYCHSNAISWSYQRACLSSTTGNESGLTKFNQPDVDIWFADESGFEGDPRPRKRYVCKNEEQLIERLDQAILDVINNPKKTQRTADFGTLF